jgi:hypothetical protein
VLLDERTEMVSGTWRQHQGHAGGRISRRDWLNSLLLNLIPVYLINAHIVFMKISNSARHALKENKCPYFHLLLVVSLTVCAVHADLVSAVPSAVQCCVCMSGIQF